MRKKTQLEAFSKSLKDAGFSTDRTLNSWYDAFDRLKELIKQSKDTKKVIFFDELSWMDCWGAQIDLLIEKTKSSTYVR